MSERLAKILETYRNPKERMFSDCREADHLTAIIADLRDFLNYEKMEKALGYDISPECAASAEHVLINVALYIELLEKELEEMK